MDEGRHRPVDLEEARTALEHFNALDPELKVLPWTGGVLRRDVRPENVEERAAFARQLGRIVDAGADGVQINVEPLASNTPGYLDLLRRIRTEIGPDKTLAIAAYPPTTPLHPFPDVHWTLEFTREVCLVADELAFMGYDTALRSGPTYQGLVEQWVRDLSATLPPPEEGGCTWWMGVPAYEDEGVGYHHPETETLENALIGVARGLQHGFPSHFRGVAVYAEWTIDDQEWEIYHRLWRGQPALPKE
jgi:hypothetical protein